MVPANIVWEGDVSTDWHNGANWAGGVKPGASDHAIFDGDDADKSCVISQDAAAFRITTQDGFNLDLTIDSGAKLVIGNGTGGNSAWAGGDIYISGTGSRLELNGGIFVMKSDFKATGTRGTVYVYGPDAVKEGAIGFTESAAELGVDLKVGYDTVGSSYGKATIFSMNGQLTLRNNASITIGYAGSLVLIQSIDPATKGGIVEDASSDASFIQNEGLVFRDGNDDAGALKIQTQFVNYGGTVRVKENSKIEFDHPGALLADYSQQGGAALILESGAEVIALSGFEFTGGDLVTVHHATAQTTTASLEGDVLWTSAGNIWVGDDDTIDRYCVLSIDGSLTMVNGGLVVAVDGANAERCDRIEVADEAVLDHDTGGPPDGDFTIYVTFIFATPPNGRSWEILTTGEGLTGDLFESYELLGFAPDTITLANVGGDLLVEAVN